MTRPASRMMLTSRRSWCAARLAGAASPAPVMAAGTRARNVATLPGFVHPTSSNCRQSTAPPTRHSSLKPRHYALGLYLNTLSWQNMLATRTGVLQVRVRFAAVGPTGPCARQELHACCSTAIVIGGTSCRLWGAACAGAGLGRAVTSATPCQPQPRSLPQPPPYFTPTHPPCPRTTRPLAQILCEQHAELFELLGRTSGKDVDKLAELARRGVGVSRRASDGIPLLVRGAATLRFVGWWPLRQPYGWGCCLLCTSSCHTAM